MTESPTGLCRRFRVHDNEPIAARGVELEKGNGQQE
jgi:hypothetical protein